MATPAARIPTTIILLALIALVVPAFSLEPDNEKKISIPKEQFEKQPVMPMSNPYSYYNNSYGGGMSGYYYMGSPGSYGGMGMPGIGMPAPAMGPTPSSNYPGSNNYKLPPDFESLTAEGEKIAAELAKNLCAIPESIAAPAVSQLQAQSTCLECLGNPAGLPVQAADQAVALAGLAAKAKSSTAEAARIRRELRFFEINGNDAVNTTYGVSWNNPKDLQKSLEEYERYIKLNDERIAQGRKKHAETQALLSALESAKGKSFTPEHHRVLLSEVTKRIDDFEQRKRRVQDGNWNEQMKQSELRIIQYQLDALEYLQAWTEEGHAFGPVPPDKVGHFIQIARHEESYLRMTLTNDETSLQLNRAAIEKIRARLKLLLDAQNNPLDDAAKLTAFESLVDSDIARATHCGLTKAEAAAIRSYTGSNYGWINSNLRLNQTDEKTTNFRDVLNSALSKLRAYQGVVRRGLSLPPDRLKDYQVGAEITYPGFTSTSLGYGFNQHHRFVIHSKNGRYVAPNSSSPGELEVLFKSGAKFRVLDRKDAEEGRVEITMEEID